MNQHFCRLCEFQVVRFFQITIVRSRRNRGDAYANLYGGLNAIGRCGTPNSGIDRGELRNTLSWASPCSSSGRTSMKNDGGKKPQSAHVTLSIRHDGGRRAGFAHVVWNLRALPAYDVSHSTPLPVRCVTLTDFDASDLIPLRASIRHTWHASHRQAGMPRRNSLRFAPFGPPTVSCVLAVARTCIRQAPPTSRGRGVATSAAARRLSGVSPSLSFFCGVLIMFCDGSSTIDIFKRSSVPNTHDWYYF